MGLFSSRKSNGTQPLPDPEKSLGERGSVSTVTAPPEYTDIIRPQPPRTPSPTPSEVEELQKGALDWKKVFSWNTWLRKKFIGWYILFLVLGVITGLIAIYHEQLVDWLTPAAQWVRHAPAGWVIPIAIIFVLSFPPLFGAEIIIVLCGLVWGLWIGFGIVAAGTFVGEVGNFYAFKYMCQARGDKLEKKNLSYACLAKAVRDGGVSLPLVARFSAIPGHFTTAVFATCGMSIWEFMLGAFLSLPKQFANVYIGVILHEASAETTAEKAISVVVIVITTLVTIFAAWWVYNKMGKYKPAVLRDRRKAKALAKAEELRQQYANKEGADLPVIDVGHQYNEDTSSGSQPQHDQGIISVQPRRWDQNTPISAHTPQIKDGPRQRNVQRQPPAADLPSSVSPYTGTTVSSGPRLSTAMPDINIITATAPDVNPLSSVENISPVFGQPSEFVPPPEEPVGRTSTSSARGGSAGIPITITRSGRRSMVEYAEYNTADGSTLTRESSTPLTRSDSGSRSSILRPEPVRSNHRRFVSSSAMPQPSNPDAGSYPRRY